MKGVDDPRYGEKNHPDLIRKNSVYENANNKNLDAVILNSHSSTNINSAPQDH